MLPVYRVAASTSLALLLMPPMVVPLLTAHSMPPSSTATPPGRTSDQPGPKAHQPVFWPAAALTPRRGRRLARDVPCCSPPRPRQKTRWEFNTQTNSPIATGRWRLEGSYFPIEQSTGDPALLVPARAIPGWSTGRVLTDRTTWRRIFNM